MNIKTSELSGRALDWAVELALGTHWSINGYFCHSPTEFNRNPKHPYSSDWAYGGPIIDSERISIRFCRDPKDISTDSLYVHAQMREYQYDGYSWGGWDFPLVAAMRCFVASKLGEEVDIPEDVLR